MIDGLVKKTYNKINSNEYVFIKKTIQTKKLKENLKKKTKNMVKSELK